MKQANDNDNRIELDFEVDCLTNSIRNVISGDSFTTSIALVSATDLKKATKEKKWKFNWQSECTDSSKEVYKLTIVNNAHIIQGLLSLSVKAEHIYINLLESAPFNIGKNKLYEGVAGNLVAYACKISFERGFDGYVSFMAKTKLIEHYRKTLGAELFRGQIMIINTIAAKNLVNKYF